MGDIIDDRALSPLASPMTSPMPGRSPSLSPQTSPLRGGASPLGAPGGRGGLSPGEQSAAEGAKSKLERMAKLEAMVEKRKNCFAYLKKTHGGDSYWLNCVLLRRQTDLAIYATELPRQRVLQLFYLGLSLARLLQSCGGAALVKGVLQVMEEWEYHFAGSATQSVRGLMAKGIDHPFPLANNGQINQSAEGSSGGTGASQQDETAVTAKLYKFNNDVVYEHLLAPPVPFALDYFQVFFSLCDIVCLIYNKFMDDECYGNAYIFDALIKVDAKIKRHVLNVTAKEFTDMCSNIVKAELGHLR